MKILALCHDFPSPSFSDTLAVFHLLKHLSRSFGHEVILVSFLSGDERYCGELEKFCSIETPVRIQRAKSVAGIVTQSIKRMMDLRNLLSKIRSGGPFISPLDYYYSQLMSRRIQEVMAREKPDILYLTRPMAAYVQTIPLPKIIQPYDAVYEWHRQMYRAAKGVKKLLYYATYRMTRSYEAKLYSKFDACLVVTKEDRELLCSLCSHINCIVLPNGVDTEYFKPIDTEEDFPSLIFVSDMSGSPTTDNVLHFYKEILPMIRKELPEVKLYLVGRNPVDEIANLACDPQVTVTGYVESVRPYLAKSSIFIAPMILGTGIKTKVLEAMAMGKPVLTTSIGAQGIDAISGEDMIIADDPREFAVYAVELLRNKQLRKRLGDNARKLMEAKYSWKEMAERLHQIFREVVNSA